MIDIHDVITDGRILMQRYIVRDGFVFTAITHPGNIYDSIVLRVPCDAPCSSPLLPKSERSLEEHIEFIRENQIEKALVIADNLDFILECPNLKHLHVLPADNANENFTFSPLYEMPALKSLHCQTVAGNAYNQKEKNKKQLFFIDYANLQDLESISICQQGHVNYNKVRTLKSLSVSGYHDADLTHLFSSPVLNTLMMIQCNVKTLEGIQQSQHMQCLYLHYNRLLYDITALRRVKRTLKALRIENCPKIKDFSVLGELENLDLLELTGSNELPNLNFLLTMKNLKTFIFNMNVNNGDLSPCLNLTYVYSEKDRKHYNLKNKDLPKGKYVRGNETIEPWLRLE